ncbi:MAG: CHAT domain-containing protein [Candidatus Xenobiia bacterium LiM19]
MKKFTLCLLILTVLFSVIPAYGQDQQSFLMQMKTKMAILEKEKTALQLKKDHKYREAARLYEEAVLLEMQAIQAFKGDQGFIREMGQSLVSSLLSAAWCYRNGNEYQKAEKILQASAECAKQLQDAGRVYDVCEEYANLYAGKGDYKNFLTAYYMATGVLAAMIQKEWGITIDLGNSQTLKPAIARFEKELAGIIAGDYSEEKKASRDLISRISRHQYLDFPCFNLLYSMKLYEEAMKVVNDENTLAFQSVVTRLVTPKLMKSLADDLQKGDKEKQVDAVVLMGFLYNIHIMNFTSVHQRITSRGMFQRYLERYREALASFNEAEVLLERAEKDALLGVETLSIYKISNTFHTARTLQKMGERKKALELYNECIRLCDKTPYYKKFILPRIYFYIGDTCFEMGDTGSAAAYADKSEHAWQEVPVEPDIIWQLYNLRGKVAETKGDPDRALKEYLESLSWIEKSRADLFSGQSMEGFIDDKIQAYEGAVRIHSAQGKIKEALQYVEKARARCLAEQMTPSLFSMIEGAAIPDAVKKEMQVLIFSINNDRASLDAMGNSNAPGNKQEIMEINKRMAENYSKLLSLLKEKCGVETANLFCGEMVDLDDFQAKIDKDTAYLEYFSYEGYDGVPGKVLLWTLTSGNITCTALPATPSELENEVREIREAINERDPQWKMISRKLYGALIAPVEGLLKDKRRVVISPHRFLHYLPFHALLDKEGMPLLERFRIVYSPSIVSSAIGKKREIFQGEKTVAFSIGNVQYEDFSPLPGTKEEVKAVAAIFPDCKVIEEKSFTKKGTEENMKGRNIIHFATHGDFNSDSPNESCLIASDGKITIDEIVKAPKMNSRIVVLSACKTGLGKLFPGDDQVGITRAFMYAGAPSIVSSLWSVSDESTTKLMTFFYKNLARKMDKDEALRQAELSLMKGYPDPMHWAPFILTGEWK